MIYEGKDYEGNVVQGEKEERSDGSVWIGFWKGNKSVWVNCKVDKDSVKKVENNS